CDGGFKIQISGPADRVCIIQSSTNLVDWTATGVSTLAGGLFDFDDVELTKHGERFYRIWLLAFDSGDVQKPTLAIIAPTANEQWSNSVFTLDCTACDNESVA